MKNYKDISGWFNYESTYDFLTNKIPTNGTFVECGAWLGKSSIYLCSICKKKNINVYIVDSWEGSISELQTTHRLAKEEDIFMIFINNLSGYDYTPIKAKSNDASKLFDIQSCDVVFIDMEHTYEAVKNDIEIWLPKIKIGGYLAGHDYSNDWPGVIKAVNEIFGRENIIQMGDCWIYEVKNVRSS